jgi:catalase
VVHAQGIGAHGYFQVTDPSIASLCKADIFSSVGKKTDAFVRFSSVTLERGAADTIRDPRGFSMKFYTNEGNWDLVANVRTDSSSVHGLGHAWLLRGCCVALSRLKTRRSPASDHDAVDSGVFNAWHDKNSTPRFTANSTFSIRLPLLQNIPVFFIRDGMEFPSLIHSQKRDPKTNLKDPNAFWDFLGHRPESVHAVTMLFGDRGIPASWRHTNAYGNHTFVLVSKEGKRTFVKFHVRAQDGVKTLTSDAAEAIRGGDPDFLSRDLVDFLMAGGEAKWNFFIQAIPEEDAAKLPYDIMDVTKVVPHGDYPLLKVGELVLNRMVDNFFGETEQVRACAGTES